MTQARTHTLEGPCSGSAGSCQGDDSPFVHLTLPPVCPEMVSFPED
jgi:hypothetical protein